MKKVGLLFTLVFGLIGVGLLAGALYALSSTISFRSNSKRAEGVVVDLDWRSGSASPVVEWKDPKGGVHRISGGVSSKPPAYSKGEKVDVRYDAANPDHARIDGFLENWFVAMILGILGAVFGGVGAGFGIYGWVQKKNRDWLRVNGLRIQAKFTGVDINTSLRVNGRSPWVLTSQWQDPKSGMVYAFRSESIWFDPSPYVKADTLDVLINAAKPSMYWIDIAFLPKQAN
jgi:hypothetical protein